MIACSLFSRLIVLVLFFQEETYEWGNPKAGTTIALEAKEKSVAQAAFRWRMKLQSSPHEIPRKGAFENFRIILKSTKKDNLQNLIEAGGGVVIDVE